MRLQNHVQTGDKNTVDIDVCISVDHRVGVYEVTLSRLGVIIYTKGRDRLEGLGIRPLQLYSDREQSSCENFKMSLRLQQSTLRK